MNLNRLLKLASLVFAYPMIPVGFILRSLIMGYNVGASVQENLAVTKRQ